MKKSNFQNISSEHKVVLNFYPSVYIDLQWEYIASHRIANTFVNLMKGIHKLRGGANINKVPSR